MKQIRSLFEVQEHLRRVIALNFLESVWVRCEIAAVSRARGHHFLSLVQKGENNLQIVAQAEGVIWASTFSKWRKTYGKTVDSILQTGLEVAFCIKMDFHERYGLKLLIEDIDPAFTIGQLELLRRETLLQLEAKALIGKNRILLFPKVIQRIAVLSSEQAAGYQDFVQQLHHNPFGYQFDYQLFATTVQGETVQKELRAQLQVIQRQAKRFDAVVITRGGGARLDLVAFDDFSICEAIANFPLPVLTGIGHDVDEVVADKVAYLALKTPTAVADFLIQHNLEFETEMLQIARHIQWRTAQMIKNKQLDLNYLASNISFHIHKRLEQQHFRLDVLKKNIPRLINAQLQLANQRIEHLEKMCTWIAISQHLKRGLALVHKDGQTIHSVYDLQPGDRIVLQLADGSIEAVIQG